MKNVIPLIVSVILGLAAVFAVSKLLFDKKETNTEDKVSVVVAARDLAAQDELREGSVTYRDMPKSLVPRNALLWENVGMVYGQQIPHAIMRDDYVLLTDIRTRTTLGECCRRGEWTIPVTFSDPALVKMLMPDDEIAILTAAVTRSASMQQASIPTVEAAGTPPNVTMTERRETSVLLPCVRVIGIASDKGSFREGGSSTGTIFVSLPPQQAMILVAAQRESELYPVLRKRNDPAALNRKDVGVVNSETFSRIHSGLKSAELPEIPNKDHR